MKTSLTHKLISVIAGGLVFLSCASNVLTGQTIKESRDVPSFSAISLAFSGNVYITQGSPQKVEIEADKGTMDIIKTEVKDDKLILKTKEGSWRNLGVIKVYITVPDISSLSVSGSGDILCESLNSGELELMVSGSGSIKLNNLQAREIDANITGSGDMILSGNSNAESEMDVTITGSGSFKAESLPVGEVMVKITGSGSATVNAVKELETNITGSGSVYYKGTPSVNASATGSGKTKSVN